MVRWMGQKRSNALVAVAFALLFAACILAVSLFPRPALADDGSDSSDLPVVKVGYYESRGFLEGASDGTVKSGYGYEYLQKVAAYSGWRFEYVYGTWGELYAKLQAGEIDLLPGVSAGSGHAAEVLLPSVGMLNETFYIYKGASDGSILPGEAGSFAGKRIAVSGASSASGLLADWLSANSCDSQVVTLDSAGACLDAFEQGQVDAFVGADNAVHGVEGVQAVEIIGREPYFLAVSPKRPDALLSVNKAITLMSTQDKAFLADLQSRYTADSSVNVFLSPEELAWTEAHPRVKIGFLKNYLPFCDVDAAGNPTGLMVDMFASMADGLPGTWDPELDYIGFDDQADLLQALRSGDVDLAFSVGGSTSFAEQDGYLRSSAFVSPSMELVLKDPSVAGASSLRIAVNAHNLMQVDYARTHFPDAEVVECASIDECLALVRSGAADATVLNGLRASALLSSETDLSSVVLPELDDRSIGVAPGNTALLQLVNRGIGILGENYCTNISYRYTEGLVKFTVSAFVRDNWPFILACLALVVVVAAAAGVRHYRKLARETQREIEQNRRLEEALAATERANQAKDVLLGNLSHDIRTPLNGILGVLEVNGTCDDPAVARENVRKAKAASRQLVGMVDDLLEMSKLRSGEVVASSETFLVGDVVDDVIASVSDQVAAAGLELSREVDDPALRTRRVVGSPSFLQRVLSNVLDNAVRYNRPGGSVRFAAALEDVSGGVRLACTVEDTGVGMSEGFVERVFEPFAQEQAGARSCYPGSGLGMSIVGELVRLMGGSVEVRSVQGSGTKVGLRIPFAEPDGASQQVSEPTSARASAVAERERDDGEALRGMRILLVEDNELSLEIARCVLERAGADVEVARDGAEAFAAFERSPVDFFNVVLMDVKMPVMDGLAATRAIRAMARADASTVPIIALTANAFESDRKAALDAGMDEHLPKPIDLDKLLGLLASLHSKASS